MKLQATSLKLFLFASFFLLLMFSAQDVSAQNYNNTPKVFGDYVQSNFIEDIYEDRESLEEIAKGPTTERKWTVYSDRANNSLYGSAGGYENDDKLDFMEMVVVEEVETVGNHEWLHVYSKYYKEEGRKAEEHKERGWIRADKVILSNYALLNDQSIPRKQMILYALDIKNIDPDINQFYPYYKKPNAGDKNEIGTARRFQIYYVLKEEASWVLLSKTDKLSGSEEKPNVVGWIQKKYTTNWDHRICYEPAFGKKAKEVYGDKKLPVFYKKNYLETFTENEIIKKEDIIKKWKIKDKRHDPYVMRMPILENIDKNKKRVVSIHNISQGGQDTAVSKAEIKKKIQKLKEKQKNINILFVVDGTESMKPYYPEVRKSIKDIIESQELKNDETSLRFGLSIYRDYPDKEEKFENIPLTNEHEDVVEELRLVECKSEDSDLPEAQYQGMVKGINKAGFNQANSNVVVLIGDAGNHKPDPKGYEVKDVVDKLYEKKASLISFQVINGNDDSFENFNWDIQDYFIKSSQEYVENKNEVKWVDMENIENTYKLGYPSYKEKNKSLFMFGRFTYASGDQPMKPSVLKTNITESVQSYLEKVDDVIAYWEQFLGGGKQPVDEETERFLRNQGFSEQEIQVLKNLGEFSMKGYLSKKYYNNDVNCFKPVVFLSEGEKRQIEDIFKSLTYGGSSITNKKKALQDALLEQCKKILGDVSDANIKNKTMNEIWQIILDIPFTGNSLIKNKKLREIKSLSDKTFRKFYKDFEESAKRFTRSSYRNSKFTLADRDFYWIPLRDLPGN